MTIVEKRARVVINSLREGEAQASMLEQYKWDDVHHCITRKIPKTGLKKEMKREIMKKIKARRIELSEQRPDMTPEQVHDKLSNEVALMINNAKKSLIRVFPPVQPMLTRRERMLLRTTGRIRKKK